MSVIVNYNTEKELDEDFEQYLNIALANGFSKGTANVSPADMKKLRPLLSYYRKKAHPFTACVRDNRKRFGPLTEKYCAVLKDLIEGNTHWRNQKKKKNLSEEVLKALYELDIPDGFFHALSEWEPDESLFEEEGEDAIADTAWNKFKGSRYLEDKINAVLNEDSDEYSPRDYWVSDLAEGKALVCHGGNEYYAVPFTTDSSGDVEIADESEWVEVNMEWENEDSHDAHMSEGVMAEVYLANTGPVEEKNGLIWKTIAKEGTWKYSPGPGQKPIAKPLTFVRDGRSDYKDLTVSIEELKQNFYAGAKQYVTVPLTHADNVLDNTGFVREMKIEEDEDGKALLKAGIEFTEPEVKEKVLRKSIADISSGIQFDYIKKDSGSKYDAIVAHAALTNNPWLNGMASFETGMSDKIEVMAFSEEVESSTRDTDSGHQKAVDDKEQANMSEEESSQMPQGGDNVETVEESAPIEETIEVQPTFLSELGISEDEAKARLAEYAHLKEEQKQNKIDERCRKWQEEGVSPALVLAAKSILVADQGVAVLNLSEDGAEKTLTATDIVDRLIAAAPHVELAEDKVTDQDAEGQAPPADAEDENSKAKLTLAERSLALQLMLEAAMSEEEAIAEAKLRLKDTK